MAWIGHALLKLFLLFFYAVRYCVCCVCSKAKSCEKHQVFARDMYCKMSVMSRAEDDDTFVSRCGIHDLIARMSFYAHPFPLKTADGFSFLEIVPIFDFRSSRRDAGYFHGESVIFHFFLR
ncbi:hypothetical protein F4802DRAFT_553264, partial [Xylaria palmicola]